MIEENEQNQTSITTHDSEQSAVHPLPHFAGASGSRNRSTQFL
jgi:hypothetical protein